MNMRAVGLVAAVLPTCLPGCVDVNEDVITGLTPGAYGSEAVFQALVNASYEPLRSFWAQERGFTLTEFGTDRSEEHTSELQSQSNLVCRLLLEKKTPSPHPGRGSRCTRQCHG